MDSIPARLRRNGTSTSYKSKLGYSYKKGVEWIEQNFEEYYLEAMAAARSLMSMGIEHGSCICILSFNRPEWIIADVACMMAGGIPAGIYQTCSPSEVQYIIHHSESRLVFVENQQQWEKVHQELDKLPLLAHIITMKGFQIEISPEKDEAVLAAT